MTRQWFVALVLVFASATASADPITSTASGGSWFKASTWVGGVIPAAGDDVVIAGPVTVAGVAACRDLLVQAGASVNPILTTPPRTLQVQGSLTNRGSIGTANPFYLDVEVAGDVYQAGAWNTHTTRLIGSGDRQVSAEPAHGITTDLAFAAGASGDLIATTALSLSGSASFTPGRLVLQPGCPLTLDAASLAGTVIAGGNELRFVSWSYLGQCTLDDAVLVGEVEAFGVTATTRLTVMDVLQNASGGGSVLVQGDLVNHGIIRHQSYSFAVSVSGDVENYGTISNPTFVLTGTGVTHHLSMSPGAVMSAPILMPEFEAATLVADTPLRLAGGLGLGVGTLVLMPGCPLEFSSFAGLGSGTVLAAGNEISVSGSGSVSGVTIDQGVCGDRLVVRSEALFTNGLVVSGTLTGHPSTSTVITVDGRLENHGQVEDNGQPFNVTALGDIANHGTFTNARITLAGTVNQLVGAGLQGLAVPAFVMESNLDASSYQWYRDGMALPGETGSALTLAMIDASDYGDYHCEADGETSRSVTIMESLAATGVPVSTSAVVSGALAQNVPNPFNPVTRIAFRIDARERVSLVVYDMAGRVVERLVDRELAAGSHEIVWQPRSLASGTYVYRLRAGTLDLVRKCSLLK